MSRIFIRRDRERIQKKGTLKTKSMEPGNTWEVFKELCRIRLKNKGPV